MVGDVPAASASGGRSGRGDPAAPPEARCPPHREQLLQEVKGKRHGVANSLRDAPPARLPLPQISALSRAGLAARPGRRSSRRKQIRGRALPGGPAIPTPHHRIPLHDCFPSLLSILLGTNTSTLEKEGGSSEDFITSPSPSPRRLPSPPILERREK